MKKSLVALAALAVVGAASAQSSVTVYGRIAIGIVKDTNGQSARLDNSNGTNQLGFRGVEDLGGGLKATFDLRHRFSPESGSMDGTGNARPFWQGSTKVGLAGSFGSVEIGRMLTALQGPVSGSDVFSTETVGSVHNLPTGYATDFRGPDGSGLARSDVITYTSPNMGGFSGALSYGLKTSAMVTPRTVGAKSLISLWLSFANGPVYVAGGYERNRSDDNIAAILGSYNFGMAKVMAGYSTIDTVAIAGSKSKAFNVGVAAPFGATTLKAGYGQTKAEGTGLKTKKLGIGAEYALSKRTYLFTTYGRTKPAVGSKINGFDLGVSHSF